MLHASITVCAWVGVILLALPIFAAGPVGCIFTLLPAVLLFISGGMIDAGLLAGWILFGIAIANVIIKGIILKIWVSKSDKTSDSIYKKCKETGVLSIGTEENQKKLLAIAGEFGVEDVNIAVAHFNKGKKSDGIGCFLVGFVILDLFVLVLAALIGINAGGSNSNHGYDNEACPVCHREFQYDSENARSIRFNGMCTNCYENYKYASDALKERPVG